MQPKRLHHLCQKEETLLGANHHPGGDSKHVTLGSPGCAARNKESKKRKVKIGALKRGCPNLHTPAVVTLIFRQRSSSASHCRGFHDMSSSTSAAAGAGSEECLDCAPTSTTTASDQPIVSSVEDPLDVRTFIPPLTLSPLHLPTPLVTIEVSLLSLCPCL